MKKLMVRVVYPNGLTASWAYDANDQLLQVRNAFPTNIISQYDYTYDVAGRRITCAKSGSAFAQNDTLSYGYNEKSELTNAVAAVDANYRYAYEFDDIGNRESSSERGMNSVYTANNLNQYTAVDDFVPQFDDDMRPRQRRRVARRSEATEPRSGRKRPRNQTLIKTAAGIWSVTYNGENRPIRWSNGSTNIVMAFDRMGRRVAKNDLRFVYDGYLQIANFEVASTNSQLTTYNAQLFIWDPTEPVATRPLVWNSSALQPFNFLTSYYAHDGNKNVSEVVASDCTLAAHYDYTPFGAVIAQRGTSAASNPWRFSSEFAEDDTATVYYNYRHYDPIAGRWLSRDMIEENGGIAVYCISLNNVQTGIDYVGLEGDYPKVPFFNDEKQMPRKIYALVKTVKDGPTKTGNNEWSIHVRFVPRFTPPEPYWTGRANIPKYPKFLAGSKWGTDDDMWTPPPGEPDLTDGDWGESVQEKAGQTVAQNPLYRHYFPNKKFSYGWYLYVRDIGNAWPETSADFNNTMYDRLSLERPGHFLSKEDEHVRTTLKCCQETVVIHGDKGCRNPSAVTFKSDCPNR